MQKVTVIGKDYILCENSRYLKEWNRYETHEETLERVFYQGKLKHDHLEILKIDRSDGTEIYSNVSPKAMSATRDYLNVVIYETELDSLFFIPKETNDFQLDYCMAFYPKKINKRYLGFAYTQNNNVVTCENYEEVQEAIIDSHTKKREDGQNGLNR